MQKIEYDNHAGVIPVQGMHRVSCPDCRGTGHRRPRQMYVPEPCQTCDQLGKVWEADKLAPLPTKRCPKCAGIGWVLPHTALEHCELCNGLGKVAQYD